MKKRITALFISLSIILVIPAGWISGGTVQAAQKQLNINTAKTTALANSDTYSGIQNKLTLARVKYTQAVKKLKLKEKNQRSFRWSPLLNFKLPEKPNLSDAYSYAYEPLEMQSEIDQLKHQLDDSVYGIYETVELQFVELYRLQEEISYNEELLTSYEKTLQRNQARLLIGQATQTDVDSMKTKISTLKKTIAADERSLEAGQEKLGTLMGMDLTGYTYATPFVDADMERKDLDTLIEATLDRSDTYYQAQQTAANALLSLNTNYSLMEKQYGSSKMSIIDSYINRAKNGQKLDSAAFKLKYNEFLNAVDEPWNGYFRILFVKIPKEWLKGSIDGVRYVEDEPYALYEAAVEYQNALADQNATKAEITQNVKDSFENYISAKNAVSTAKENLEAKSKELKKDSYLNMSGKMTYEEYSAVQSEYEELQLDYLQAQADYSGILYSFNRLTCGKVSEYMTGEFVNLSTASGGNSYVVEDEGDGIYYYIRSLVSDNMFELGLSTSENLETDIDSYELWIDGVQVGSRTTIESTIRHLALDTQEAEKVIIRLYAGDKFVDDCEIDPTVYSGKLTVTDYHVEQRETYEAVAYYTVTTMSSGFMQLTITPKDGKDIASFVIRDLDGTALVSEEPIKVGERFQYLPAANNSLDELTVSLYDSSGALYCEGSFNTGDQMIYRKTE